MFTSIAVSLENVLQRTTKILPFNFNGHFSQFPNFIKMWQTTGNMQLRQRKNESRCLILI